MVNCLTQSIANILSVSPESIDVSDPPHIREIVDWLIEHGYTLTPVDRYPASAEWGSDGFKPLWDESTADSKFREFIRHRVGILIQPHHAIAWDGEQAIDPRGFIWAEIPNEVYQFWWLVSL